MSFRLVMIFIIVKHIIIKKYKLIFRKIDMLRYNNKFYYQHHTYILDVKTNTYRFFKLFKFL